MYLNYQCIQCCGYGDDALVWVRTFIGKVTFLCFTFGFVTIPFHNVTVSQLQKVKSSLCYCAWQWESAIVPWLWDLLQNISVLLSIPFKNMATFLMFTTALGPSGKKWKKAGLDFTFEIALSQLPLHLVYQFLKQLER